MKSSYVFSILILGMLQNAVAEIPVQDLRTIPSGILSAEQLGQRKVIELNAGEESQMLPVQSLGTDGDGHMRTSKFICGAPLMDEQSVAYRRAQARDLYQHDKKEIKLSENSAALINSEQVVLCRSKDRPTLNDETVTTVRCRYFVQAVPSRWASDIRLDVFKLVRSSLAHSWPDANWSLDIADLSQQKVDNMNQFKRQMLASCSEQVSNSFGGQKNISKLDSVMVTTAVYSWNGKSKNFDYIHNLWTDSAVRNVLEVFKSAEAGNKDSEQLPAEWTKAIEVQNLESMNEVESRLRKLKALQEQK